MPTATLTSKGQMVIPKSIREQLDLKPAIPSISSSRKTAISWSVCVQKVQKLKGMLYRSGRKPVSIEDMNLVIKKRNA